MEDLKIAVAAYERLYTNDRSHGEALVNASYALALKQHAAGELDAAIATARKAAEVASAINNDLLLARVSHALGSWT